ncbi:fumarylacetoacetate hydrolase family protein [Fodinicurvata sediminis]|uniref:fumarylacetoacetate hydrolase family protein n=1 Tax=Fodinicurvata sediminis TaxID=1121832 RepID=UPI0003B3C0B8|nr:fumarylacetoacetate hydrolase family protein [Fodinicurvata sediminis]
MTDIPAPWTHPFLPIHGRQETFPVRRIFCVGRNYSEHVQEMGEDSRELPFFFMKPASSLLPEGQDFPYPSESQNVHHEIELVVALGTGGRNITRDKTRQHIFGYGVGLDMTRRDLQGEAKKKGRPWEVGKAFDCSAPCSRLYPASDIGHPSEGRIALSVDGEERQSGDLAQMTWSVEELLAHLSRYFTLHPGDLIYTGTPAGVGPVLPGNSLYGSIERIGELTCQVVQS